MPDPDRIQRDKATILSIIKYVLFTVIIGGVIYFGAKLIWILFPFVIGFILAKVASNLAKVWLETGYKIKCRRRQRKLGQDAARCQAAAGAESETGAVPDGQPDGKEAAAEAAPASDRKKLLRGKNQYPRGLARSHRETRLAIIFYFLEVIAVFALIIVVIIGCISQLRSLANYLPDFVKNSDLVNRISGYLSGLSARFGGIFQTDFLQYVENALTDLQQRLSEAMPNIVSAILNGIGAFAGYLPILFFIIVVIIMSGYYFITDSRNLYVFLRRNITSKSFREKSVRLVNSLSTTLFRVIGGYLLLLIVTFLEALGGLLIIRMPYAVIIAMVAAIVDFLPVLGISATLIPVSIYLFINNNIFGGLGALVLLAIMSLVRRVIEPAILGNAMKLHPMATLAAMIVGIAIYGLGGIILGPIILVIVKDVMRLYGFDKKIRSLIGDVLNKVSP